MNGRFERRRFLGLMGAGGLVAGGAIAGHVATALPSEASEALAREDTNYAPIAEGIQQVVWSVATGEPAVALTFDDGPNAAFTPRVLEMLAAAGGRATFFVVGVQVEQERALVRRLLAEGHELGNHTWAHESPAVLTAEQTRHEIERGTEAITRVAGQPPRWYRPPRGMVTGSAVHRAHQLGQGLAMWSADRGPAGDIDVEGIARHLVDQLRPGAVFDLHDGVGAASGRPPTEWPALLIRRREAELAALPQLLAAASARGIRLVTLTDLVALGSA